MSDPIAARWDEIPAEQVRPGVDRRGFGTDRCLLVMNHCHPGMDLNPHRHDFDQIAMFTQGKAIYSIGGTENEVGPGSVLLIPAGAEHFCRPIGEEVVHNLDVFAPARPDYQHLTDWMKNR